MLTREDIVGALKELGDQAQEAGVLVDLGIYGGSAIALEWQFRTSTRDVDVVIKGNSAFVREAAKRIALSRDWPENWLNDAVKGFVSSRGEHRVYAEYMSAERYGGLRVFVPTTEYLLAMKCLAMRINDPEGHDVSDIKHLVQRLGLKTTDEVLGIVEKYYPRNQLSPKMFYGIQEILQSLLQKPKGHDERPAHKPQATPPKPE
ncbi:MAG: hypothetical protein ACYDDA_13410 [Acidiferrobacteraceae bacterium]